SSVSRTSISRSPPSPASNSASSSPTASACAGSSSAVPISLTRASSSSSPTWRASHCDRTVTIWSSARPLGSGLVDIGGQQHILTDRAGRQTLQVQRAREVGHGVRPCPGHGRRDEDEKLVHEVCGQKGRGQRRPALEE